jgi:hypothetical protein
VTDSVATFDRIDPQQSAPAPAPFQVQVLPGAVSGQAAGFTIHWNSTAGPAGECSFSLPIGVASNAAPLGPDQYGHWAYDNSDTDYPAGTPLYTWVECSTAYGGAGTKLGISTDRSVQVSLPDEFSFVFYGRPCRNLQINENGWLSFNTSVSFSDYYNWPLPSAFGSGGRIAPFWDNLDALKKDVGGHVTVDGVYTWFDAQNHRYVVEWSRIGNTDNTGQGGVVYTDLQTFEVILLDPAFFETPTGDGIILFQYKQILNVDKSRMYSTVGIENEASDDAVQYTYCNTYPVQSAPLSDGLAIKFTTEKPVYSPFRLSTFEALPGEAGVLLSWTPIDDRPRGGYRIYRSAAGDKRGPVEVGRIGPEARSYLDTAAGADSAYTYRIGSTDPVGRETLLGPYEYAGGGRAWKLSVSATTGNPFRGACTLTYTVPRSGSAGLRIYDVAGRSVRTLIDGTTTAGPHTIAWDGKDGSGRDLPGGVYFARLQAGGDKRELKLTILR